MLAALRCAVLREMGLAFYTSGALATTRSLVFEDNNNALARLLRSFSESSAAVTPSHHHSIKLPPRPGT